MWRYSLFSLQPRLESNWREKRKELYNLESRDQVELPNACPTTNAQFLHKKQIHTTKRIHKRLNQQQRQLERQKVILCKVTFALEFSLLRSGQ